MSFSSNRFTTLLLLAFFSLFFLPRFASAETFYRNLKRGDSGQDVFALQKFLNQNSETRVAESMKMKKGVTKAQENAPNPPPPPPPPLPDVTKPPVAMNNPNLENLDYFLSAVRSVGEKRGYTKEKLALIENQ